MSSFTESIKVAKDLAIWLNEKTNEREIPGAIRVRTGVAILQLSLDLGDAMLVLLEANLPGPALTLARPLFEGYVRGVWLLECASDASVEKFNDGKCPLFPELLNAIGTDELTGGAWIHANKNANWGAFNDLTHGGSEHVKRRSAKDAVEANYPESELEALVNLGIEVRIRIGASLLALMNDETAMEQLNRKAKAHRLAPSSVSPSGTAKLARHPAR